jgi:hypothetical protein
MVATIRSYTSWSAINTTPTDPDFNLDAGVYGLTLRATAWGSATLQRVLSLTGPILVAVAPAVIADGYAVVQLPAGRYRLTLAGVTALTGAIELIAPGSG